MWVCKGKTNQNWNCLAYNTSDPKIGNSLSSETAIVAGNMISEEAPHATPIQTCDFNNPSCGFFSPVLINGCTARVSTGYTIHDGYYNDDHVWDGTEVGFYSRWEGWKPIEVMWISANAPRNGAERVFYLASRPALTIERGVSIFGGPYIPIRLFSGTWGN